MITGGLAAVSTEPGRAYNEGIAPDPGSCGHVISVDTALRTGVFYAYTAGVGKTSCLKHGESSGAPSSPPAHEPPQFSQQRQDTMSIAGKIAHKTESAPRSRSGSARQSA